MRPRPASEREVGTDPAGDIAKVISFLRKKVR